MTPSVSPATPPSPPPADPPPTPPSTPPSVCGQLGSLTNLQALSPPEWCYHRSSNASTCESFYVTYTLEGELMYANCWYSTETKACRVSDPEHCEFQPPPPPARLPPPTPPPPTPPPPPDCSFALGGREPLASMGLNNCEEIRRPQRGCELYYFLDSQGRVAICSLTATGLFGLRKVALRPESPLYTLYIIQKVALRPNPHSFSCHSFSCLCPLTTLPHPQFPPSPPCSTKMQSWTPTQLPAPLHFSASTSILHLSPQHAREHASGAITPPLTQAPSHPRIASR